MIASRVGILLKMKNRIELAQYFAKLGFTKGAEIGVCQGQYSKKLLDLIPGLHLLSIDSWNKYDASGACYEITKKLLAPYHGSTVIQATSMDAVKIIEDESLDFVFIDAGHSYVDVRDDIREWSKKVRKGGIVAGHDYYSPKYHSVTRAVDEYVQEHNLGLKIVAWDLENPDREERQPSWYFFKE